jgi:hypothetical protein
MQQQKIADAYWTAAGCPAAPVAEHRFCPGRRFRFDYAFVEHKVAIEIEGGIWTQGRHTRGSGFAGDMEKYNIAATMGWRLLRYPPGRVNFIQVAQAVNYGN